MAGNELCRDGEREQGTDAPPELRRTASTAVHSLPTAQSPSLARSSLSQSSQSAAARPASERDAMRCHPSLVNARATTANSAQSQIHPTLNTVVAVCSSASVRRSPRWRGEGASERERGDAQEGRQTRRRRRRLLVVLQVRLHRQHSDSCVRERGCEASGQDARGESGSRGEEGAREDGSPSHLARPGRGTVL